MHTPSDLLNATQLQLNKANILLIRKNMPIFER
jgi:hypothetical protein